MAARPYKRLPGRSAGSFYTASLWEADDHILLVESYRVSESYKRFFLRDIQAIVICRTKGGMVLTIVLGVLAVIFGACAFAAPDPARIVLGILGGTLAVLALMNFLRGPTCRCTLKTAVQTQVLPSLKHLRTARKLLLRIRPKIEAAQQEPPAQ